MRYALVLRYRFGEVSVQGDDRREVLGAIDDLLKLAKDVERLVSKKKRSKGKAETSAIIECLERILIPGGFFQQPRTTKEVAEQLQKVTTRTFTSRKVSQALGDLRDAGAVDRHGPKGNFRYIR